MEAGTRLVPGISRAPRPGVHRDALAPGLLLGLGGVVAGPEQWFATGQPVQERVAAVAGAGAADPLLPHGLHEPARERRAVRPAVLGRPAFEDGLLRVPVGRPPQDVLDLGPTPRQRPALRV